MKSKMKNISLGIHEKVLKDRIVTIDDKTYIRDKDKLRLMIDDYLEKIKIIGMTYEIGYEGL